MYGKAQAVLNLTSSFKRACVCVRAYMRVCMQGR